MLASGVDDGAHVGEQTGAPGRAEAIGHLARHDRGLSAAHEAVDDVKYAPAPAEDRSFAYDDLDRLVAAGTAGAPESHDYDAEGNRTVSHLSSSHTVDGLNRLTEDDAFTYDYDDNGNLVAKTDHLTLDETAYAYDAFDRLVSVTRPDASVVTYAYDALGRRIEKDVAGAVTQYVYDSSDILLEFDATGPTPVLAATFAHGPPTDQPLAQGRGGSAYYYHADHQGSVMRITDALGFTVSDYRYDAYGRTTGGFAGVANPYTYTGRELDPETGLYHYRARTYDALTGRFLQQDPLGLAAGDLNLYRYVFNNPVNFTDPFGLQCEPDPSFAYQLGQGIGIIFSFTPAGRGVRLLAASRQLLKAITARALGKKALRLASRSGNAASPIPAGSFNIVSWKGYPTWAPRPSGPFRTLSGTEYDAA